MGILHVIAKEGVQFIKVDGIMTSMEVSNFSTWVNSDQWVISSICKEGGDACSGVGSVIICKFS